MAGLVETVLVGQSDKSTTQVPRENVSPGALSGAAQYIDGFAAVVLSVVAFLLVLRKKFHQDSTDISKGRAEDKLIQTLIQQAEVYKEDARKAWEHRTRDAQQIARQENEIAHLYETIEQMQRVLHVVAPAAVSSLPKVSRPHWLANGKSNDETDAEAP